MVMVRYLSYNENSSIQNIEINVLQFTKVFTIVLKIQA